MPTLPIDSQMPQVDIHAVMLFPGGGADEQRRRESFMALKRQEALTGFFDAGGKELPDELVEFVVRHARQPSELEKRRQLGTLIGEIMNALHALFYQAPELVSWNRAMDITEDLMAGHALPHSKRTMNTAKRLLEPVAHLWGALAARGYRFKSQPEYGYTAAIDFQFFLWEAEQLRHFGLNCSPANEPSRPLFSESGWCLPDDWAPPAKKQGWPERAGEIAVRELPDSVLEAHTPAGWRKKGA